MLLQQILGAACIDVAVPCGCVCVVGVMRRSARLAHGLVTEGCAPCAWRWVCDASWYRAAAEVTPATYPRASSCS